MLEVLIGWFGTVAVFLVGLVARALLAVLVLAAIVVPIAAALVTWNWMMRMADRAAGLRQVGHVRWRRGLYYTPGHLWLQARRAGGVRIGLDDVAQRVLPEIAAVTLPEEGTPVRRGEALGRIECPEGAVVLKAPISGIVAAVNRRLLERPALLHADPYRRAWMVEVEPRDRTYEALPAGDRAKAWLAKEDRRLTDFFERQLGLAAADGGELLVPPHKLLTPAQWDAVRIGFLDADAGATRG